MPAKLQQCKKIVMSIKSRLPCFYAKEFIFYTDIFDMHVCSAVCGICMSA